MQRKAFLLPSVIIGIGLGLGFGLLGDRFWTWFQSQTSRTVQVAVHKELAANRTNRFNTQVKKAVAKAVRDELAKDAFNLLRERQRIACRQSAEFVDQHMPKTPAFRDLFALLEHSLKSVPTATDGLYCEFGVYKGKTINFIASKTKNTIHGFDSFEGLPETWRTGFKKGTFHLSNLPEVASNVELHKGWFNKSLPKWAESHRGPVVFLHMDADLYSSTKTVFDILGDRIGKGTVIQFDEYFNYSGWKDGEYKAFMEFVSQRQLQFEYIGYTWGGNAQQVAVKIK